jgi:hypothetical protein
MPVSDDKVQIAVVMTRDLKQTLKEYADSRHWSMSQAAALLIEDGLKRAKDSGNSQATT